MIMKYYLDYDLSLQKEKNKYVIDKKDFWIWLEEIQRLEEEKEKQEKILKMTLLIIIVILYN